MLFDPNDTRTQEESWEHEWSEEFKARILAAADAQDCSWFDIVQAAVDQVMEDMALDPEHYDSLMAKFRFASAPFGLDPRLQRKDGAHGYHLSRSRSVCADITGPLSDHEQYGQGLSSG